MPSVEELLKEAELAIASGEAAKGQWPPKDPSTTFWWAEAETRSTQPSAISTSNPSVNQHDEHTHPRTPKPSSPSHDSLDAFLSKKSPSIAKRFDKVESQRLKSLKLAREKSQQQAQSAPLLDLVSVKPKVNSRQSSSKSILGQSNHTASQESHPPIDQKLLKQAFEYGKSVQREVQPSALMLNGHASLNVASNQRHLAKRGGRKSGKGLRKGGRKAAVKREVTKGAKAPFRFDKDGRGEDERKAFARTEDLVRHLTQGTYVKKLQRELAQSKESMKHSDAFIRRATSQWFRTPQNL